MPFDVLDLLKKMLEKDPSNRISAKDCMTHPFIKNKEEIIVKSFGDVSFSEFSQEYNDDLNFIK